MKAFLCLLPFFLSTTALAKPCVDFSGSYKVESADPNTPISLKVEQKACEQILLSYISESGVETELFRLDGKKVLHAEYPEIGLQTFVTPAFSGNDILIDVENIWKDSPISDKFKRRFHLEFTDKVWLLDQRGNFRSDGVFVPSTQTSYIQEKSN